MEMKKHIFLLITVILFQPQVSSAQILNIDKTDTNAYQQKGVFNLNVGSGLEIDKQKITELRFPKFWKETTPQ